MLNHDNEKHKHYGFTYELT